MKKEPDRWASINRSSFECGTIALAELIKRMDFKKRFKVVLEHNPESKHVDISYYYLSDENDPAFTEQGKSSEQ